MSNGKPVKQWHRTVSMDAATNVGTCSVCGPDVPFRYRADRGRWTCKRSEQRGQRVRRRSSETARNYHLVSKYNLTADDYGAMLADQGGVCAICSLACSTGRRLAVDHCHESGRVRGLLCGACNRAVGLLKDDSRLALAAALYLRNQN